MVAVDPVASLRITTTVVVLAGREFEIGRHSAADWLELIIDGTLYKVLPGWLDDPDESATFTSMMLDGAFTEDDVNEATLNAITVAGGRRYWWVFNVIGQAASSNTAWAQLVGKMILAGLDADRIPLAAWVDALYSICTEHMDQAQRTQFDTYMEAPPRGTEWEEISEVDDFAALMASMPDAMDGFGDEQL